MDTWIPSDNISEKMKTVMKLAAILMDQKLDVNVIVITPEDQARFNTAPKNLALRFDPGGDVELMLLDGKDLAAFRAGAVEPSREVH